MSKVNTDLTKVLSKKYANKWVALNTQQTKVVAFSESPGEVLKEALKNGVKNPVITFVIEDYGFLVS